MARRQRQLVSELWQRELGVCRERSDAAAHCQYQRPADKRKRASLPLAARPPTRRSAVFERSGILRGVAVIIAKWTDIRGVNCSSLLATYNHRQGGGANAGRCS